MRARLSLTLLCLAGVVALGCGQEASPVISPTPVVSSPATTQPSYSVSSFVTGVSAADGSTGVLRSGRAPQASGGPAVQPTSNSNVINGGSTQVRLRSSSAFQTVYMFIGGVTGDVGGYWEVRLAAPTSDTTVVVSQGRSIPSSRFDAVYAVATSSGAVGGYTAVQTQVLAAGTGDVQVSASWDSASDVDLHVVDPRGAEVFYGRPSSASGGQLDLDSNAGCDIDRKNNENIRWPAGRAPAGTYTVRLDYWSSCGVASTNYVVTVNNGGSTQTFRGTFTGSGDAGDAGSGRTITTFTRAASVLAFDASDRLQPEPGLMPLAAMALEKLRVAQLRR